MEFTREEIVKTIKSLRREQDGEPYSFFENGNFNLNIVAIRSDNDISNFWDDYLVIIFKRDGEWRFVVYDEVTTDPGRTSLQHPKFPAAKINGTAIIKEGQYPGAYTVGYHIRRNHPALQQTGPIRIYRDKDKDIELDYDPDTVTEGWYGCNIHTTRPDWRGDKVYNWSAGCIVMKDWFKFQKGFMQIINRSAKLYGNEFTLTLLTEKQIREINGK